MRLSLNQKHEAIVKAKEKWNNTGIDIHPGDQYLFEAKGEWKDWRKIASADGYTHWYMNLYNKLKRSKNDKWFALIGSIERKYPFLIGSRNKIEFENPGTLYCFANDISFFYWNNHGEITLTITRLK